MGDADLVVLGNLLLPDGRIQRGGFAVQGGRIVAMGAHLTGRERFEAGDALVVAGAIDPHVHFRDPGEPAKEDFESGTRAAAQGGVTTVMDMPNTRPPVFTREALEDKRTRAQEKACVDFGLYAGLDASGDSLAIVAEAAALKIYLGATTGNLLVREDDVVRRALMACAKAGRTVAVHAESQDCLERHAHLAGDDYPSHAASRPAVCEAEAIERLTGLARGSGARVHIAHLSTAAGLAALQESDFTAEVTPHHLLLTREALMRGGRFKMNPPLRDDADGDALWGALGTGRVACLASDHAPHLVGEKDAAAMPACPAGVPGVGTMVPLLVPHALAGRLPLPRLFEASTAAARVFRLPRKGSLAVGMDADFAVYDLDGARPVRAADLEGRAGWTPFEGMPAVFPMHVRVRGVAVVEAGRVVGAAGSGRESLPPRADPA